MKKADKKVFVRRAEALVLSAALTATSLSFPTTSEAASALWQNDVNGALEDVLNGISNADDYEDAIDALNAGLNGLEGAATVEGLTVTEVGEDFVTIEWEPFESDSLVGYNVYWADKDTDTQVYDKLDSDGKKSEDDSVITVDATTLTFTIDKSTHVNYYFRVAPVLASGVGTKSVAVKSPTAKEFDAYLENLDRGLVEVETTEGVFLSWRLLGSEVTGYSETGLTGTDFNVYQDSEYVATVTDSTNYLVEGGTSSSEYYVVPVVDGVEVADKMSSAATLMNTVDGAGYLDIELQVPHDTTIEEVYGIDTSDIALLTSDRTDAYTTSTITYSANDVSVGDVDGDGEYEFFVKWDPSLSKDVSQQGYTGKQYIDCYELDGTLLYRIDLGINIRAGAHYTQFTVYDLNEDGRAELSLKTAPGTKVLTFNNNDQDDIATETYITTPDGESNDADYVYSTQDYRQHLIDMFMDWGVWAEDSEDMIAAKASWDKNLINLFAPEDGMVTVVTKGEDGKYTSTSMTREEAGYTEADVLVNVPVRDENGKVVYTSTGVANAYMETVRFDDEKTGLTESMYHDGGYTLEEATALADYFLNGYQYRMKKHNLNYYEGYIISGSEYLSVFEGATGRELDTIMYEFEREDDGMLWGDYAMNYMEPGNRCDRFISTVAYLDGENPYMVVCRGYYTRQTIATYRLNSDNRLELYWTIDSGWTVMDNPFNDGPHGMNGNNTDVGTNGISFSLFTGQGDHYVSAADVDSDGCQEIIYGGAIVDDNGDLYSSGGDYLPDGTTWAKYGHGDSIHVTDIDPDSNGLEIFSCFEGGAGAPYGTALRDAETNEAVAGNFSVYTGADTGRCMIGDLLPDVRGIEMWGVNTTDAKGNIVSVNTIGTNQNIKWSADMTTEIYTGNIVKANGTSTTTVLNTNGETSSNNGTKGNAALIADLCGDYREELVVRTNDSSALRIYTNTEVTSHKMYTLMHDIQYRANVAGQNTAYNQPSYTSFYYASDTDWEYVPIPNAKKDQEPGIVEVVPTSVSINLRSLTIKEGATGTLTAEVLPSKATDKTVTWTSTDDSIATVSDEGIVTGVSKGTVTITATTVNGYTAETTVIVKETYKENGTDEFAVGESRAYAFGLAPSYEGVQVNADTVYSDETGYGFNNADTIVLTQGDSYVSGNNVMTTTSTTTTYDYPTFEVDVPTGIYEVRIVQGSDTEDSVVGAYVEGNMYSVRWNTENFSTSFVQPSPSNNIVTPMGEYRDSTVTTAVADGRLTIQLATSLTDEGVSGNAYVNYIEIKRLSQNLGESANPTLRFIGDSTVATYPPEDGGTWTPIPERTGWGSDFAMARFLDEEVTIVNKAVAGSSIKSYIYDGYYNDFFLNSNPGDTVIIEGGINDSATGRRYSDAEDYERYLRYFIDSCKEFGLDVVISSGTSSATTYTAVMEKLADEYELPYIDLLSIFNAYKNTITSKAQGDLTVDGTHLSRVGGILAAQMVANELEKIDGLSISGYVNASEVNTEAPSATVDGIYVKAQTTNSLTLAWNIDEATMYAPDELITGFNVYRKAKGADDSAYELIGSQEAYVSASMSSPKLQVTVESAETGSYDYAVAVTGLTGEGVKSDSITVNAFEPTDRYELLELVDKYDSQMYDSTHYTAESYAKLVLALNNANDVLDNSEASDEDISLALTNVREAIDSLVSSAEVAVSDDFQSQTVGSVWGTTGHQLLTVIMEEDGNRLANAYVEAAGTRNIKKEITGVDSEQLAVEFEWYPGNPDNRNCTEIQFADNNGVYFSLKTSCNGHIGYVVGAYDTTNTGYLTGDGFHEGNELATDLGLSNEEWYNVRIVFDYADHTADLYIEARDAADVQNTVVKDIAISDNASKVTLMNFLCMRGKQDNGTSNDLSVLWDTYLDNFEISYVEDKAEADSSSYEAAVAVYDEKIAGIDKSALMDEDIVLASIVRDIMAEDVGFKTSQDYEYALTVMNNAINKIPEKQNATDINVESHVNVVAGLNSTVVAELLPAGANEVIDAVSADESIATVRADGVNIVITGVSTGSTTVTVSTASGATTDIDVNVSGTAYTFGTKGNVLTDSAYSETTGYGFKNYTYDTAAIGWVDGIYYKRELSEVEGTSYVDSALSSSDYIAINGKVWTENEGSRDEDAIRYEDTASFNVDMPDGNYTVNVTFTNPTKDSMDVMVIAEDMVRYSSGDHDSAELAAVTLQGKQTKTVSFDVALTDGSLTLRFVADDDATSVAQAALNTVYVKGVSVDKIETDETDAKPTIYVIGDSTVQTYTQNNYRTGWGQRLYTIFEGADDSSVVEETSTGYAYYSTDTVDIKNYARDARSSKSFLEEGRLNEVLLDVEAGDYVFVQFAHNDSNTARPNRYLDEEDFRTYLDMYNSAVEERGATLVLVTPIALNVYADNEWDHRFESYRQVMLDMAREDGVAVLDLMGSSYALLNELGSLNVELLSMYMSDTVHLKETGAVMYTELLSNQINAYDDTDRLDLLKPLLANTSSTVRLADNEVTLNIGQTTSLIPAVTNVDSPVVKYYSSDTSVATVDADGNVKAVDSGKAIITVSVSNGADISTSDCTVYTDYCVVDVTPLSELAMAYYTISQYAGGSDIGTVPRSAARTVEASYYEAEVVEEGEAKAYDEAAWTELRDIIAEYQVKASLMEEDATPLDYDASLINKMLYVKDALEAVNGMPAIDVQLSTNIIEQANEAIEVKDLYTESTMAVVVEALNNLNAVMAELSTVNEKVVNAINIINYWLDGVDVDGLAEAFSLYVDFDYVGTTEYLTDGYTSVLNSTIYSAETGYGLTAVSNGRNRATGDSLLDDFVMDSTFAVDLVAGKYSMRAYCGDLMANASNTTTFTITDALGNTLLSDISVSSAGGEANYVDMTFSVEDATTVNIAFKGRLNVLLIDQILPVNVEEIDISEMSALVEEIENAALVETDYTVSSYKALMSALENAKTAISQGVSYTQQYQAVYDALRTAYEGLVTREAMRELLIDFGTEISAVADSAKLSGDGGLTTMGSTVLQGLGTMLYESNTSDSGQHYGFSSEVASYETTSGGAYFRDYVYGVGGTPYTFTADMPVGTYYVYVYTGDKLSNNTTKFYFGDGGSVGSTNTAVETVDGKTVYTQTSSGGGQFSAPGAIYTVEVTASETLSKVNGVAMGQLSITLYDDTATSADAIAARLNGIEITPVDPSAPLVPDVPAHEHSYVLSDSLEATCTENGYNIYSCECGNTYTDVIYATGHTEGDWTIVEPGKTTDGSKNRYCTTCNELLETIVLPSLFSQVTVAESDTVYVGKCYNPSITLPEGLTSKDIKVTYFSSNRRVAFIIGGKIIPLRTGETTITTTIRCGTVTRTFITKLTVKEPSVSITSSYDTLKRGDRVQFSAVSEGLSGNITWVSMNPFVATVNSKTGVVTARFRGTTFIYAFDGIHYDMVKVVVK